MRCIVCESKKINRLFIKQGREFLKCNYCGLVFIAHQNYLVDLGNFYNKQYYSHWEVNGKMTEITKLNKTYTFEVWLREIEKYIAKGRILDIGCAMGFFLEVAQQRGWDVYGIDVSEYAVNLAREKFGSRVSRGTLSDIHFAPDSFDVITMFDVIEHLSSPTETLRNISMILKSKGILAISTVNTDSLSCKLMGSYWSHFKPEHLYYFSSQNIKLILDKTGFSVLEVKDSNKFLSLSYIKSYFYVYKTPILTTFSSLIELFTPSVLKNHPFKFKLGEMFVLAQKR